MTSSSTLSSSSSLLLNNRSIQSTPRRRTSKRHSREFSSSRKRSSFLLSSNPTKRITHINVASASTQAAKWYPESSQELQTVSKDYLMPNTKEAQHTKIIINFTNLIDDALGSTLKGCKENKFQLRYTGLMKYLSPEKFELAKRERLNFKEKFRKQKAISECTEDLNGGTSWIEFRWNERVEKINDKCRPR
nr:CBM_HP1_G0004190.mRNA.1.CDS.1 [Saccharomyces cerevisiae]